MASFIINGGYPLAGEVSISGAKNAALPILAASLMASGEQHIYDVPHLLDIQVMLEILNSIGVKTEHQNHHVSLDTTSLSSTTIPEHLMGKMRSSIFLIGPLLAKFGQVTLSRPGGCAIGERPIDLHLSGLRALGASISEDSGFIYCEAKQLQGGRIHLRYPSVGATENIMMAASLAKGTTRIINAAREPEISDLQRYLNQMGARISGAGTDTIYIEGVPKLSPTAYKVIPDRIITGTLLLAAAITRGEIALANVIPEHNEALLANMEACGIEIRTYRDIMTLKVNKPLKALDFIETDPYPGFPTDLQSLMMAFTATVEGTTVIKEKVFEGRFKHVDELNRMGSRITIDLNRAFVRGVPKLSGARVEAPDLRAGAALVLAGLYATDTTIVSGVHHIDRGYEHLEGMLQGIGARIKRIHDE
ncbi:UDP-N-acetylglucosamine 1-carboxyvinyltransferase [Bacillus horti]|uniref:UDP-N-acetylglucosamine 1-carboxyvinyltransferase n=1 Tax=Caldalkalibacillus horti TaxID=77523 RepID=A0ABT9VUE0_9BACI|nr:UDP-N-acetylglucosamine 1-carboxyvinyltransferase [Bacillus horti]MDQ0164608.1 UDP-N-acetylglucosamine 1-carboxyvinyltransferase [Bacillus horti]